MKISNENNSKLCSPNRSFFVSHIGPHGFSFWCYFPLSLLPFGPNGCSLHHSINPSASPLSNPSASPPSAPSYPVQTILHFQQRRPTRQLFDAPDIYSPYDGQRPELSHYCKQSDCCSIALQAYVRGKQRFLATEFWCVSGKTCIQQGLHGPASMYTTVGQRY